MRLYLDNSVVGRMVDIERCINRPSVKLQEDMAVLPYLVALCRERGIDLCTSYDSVVEVERLAIVMPEVHRRLMAQLSQLTLLPASADSDQMAQKLEQFLLQRTRVTRPEKSLAVRLDARHLGQSKNAGCNYFVTTDYASIWAYRRALEHDFGIKVRRPVELYDSLAVSPPRPEVAHL